MKVFKGFNEIGDPCLICKTKEDKETVLIPIAGSNTEEDGSKGNIYEATAVHLNCIDLFFYPGHKLFAQKLVEEKQDD